MVQLCLRGCVGTSGLVWQNFQAASVHGDVLWHVGTGCVPAPSFGNLLQLLAPVAIGRQCFGCDRASRCATGGERATRLRVGDRDIVDPLFLRMPGCGSPVFGFVGIVQN